MSNFLSKIGVKTAVSCKHKMDLSCDHVTTTDFFKFKPIYIKEMVPGERIHLNMSTFTRLMPMDQPMLGGATIINRAFFVKCRQVMKSFDAFITDSKYTSGSSSSFVSMVPYVTDDGLVSTINNFASNVSSGEDYVMASTPGGSTFVKRKLNRNGKMVYDIIHSLGYGVNFTKRSTDKMSALPLMAFFKVFNDWYLNSQYNASITILETVFATTGEVTSSQLIGAFNAILNLPYETDYFTSAWDNPNTPNTNDEISAMQFKDLANASAGYVDVQAGGADYTPVLRNFNSGISNYLMETLHRVTDYFKRHQLVGARPLDRFYSRFGMELEGENILRSQYIGKSVVPVQISDVMSTTEGEGSISKLGDYAGKGVGFDGSSIDYETNEYGYLIVVSVCIPRVGYVQGNRRFNQHLTKTDFYTPEFDGLGAQPIRFDELYCDSKTEADSVAAGIPVRSAVWAWTPRYAEYCVANDTLSGDFIMGSVNNNGTMNSWHTYRMFDSEGIIDNSFQVHGPGFAGSNADGSQYDRIFAQQSNAYDHFYCVHHFNVISITPKKPLYDNYEWDDEATGKEVKITLGGTKLS